MFTDRIYLYYIIYGCWRACLRKKIARGNRLDFIRHVYYVYRLSQLSEMQPNSLRRNEINDFGE